MKSTISKNKAGVPAITVLESLTKNHEFYLSSMSEEGPIARRVKVLAVDGPCAIVDTYNFADLEWQHAPVAIDLTRTRYVAPASPMTIDITEEKATETKLHEAEEFKPEATGPGEGGAN